uniref:Uncharacterized protein n=1 Tax=Helianthus annuus TaxID=4232 RepID=A0A251V8R2_HELAN
MNQSKDIAASSSIRWCHDIGGEHATNKPLIKTIEVIALSSYEEKDEQFKEQVKMIEVSRKSEHATQANGEGGSLA